MKTSLLCCRMLKFMHLFSYYAFCMNFLKVPPQCRLHICLAQNKHLLISFSVSVSEVSLDTYQWIRTYACASARAHTHTHALIQAGPGEPQVHFRPELKVLAPHDSPVTLRQQVQTCQVPFITVILTQRPTASFMCLGVISPAKSWQMRQGMERLPLRPSERDK